MIVCQVHKRMVKVCDMFKIDDKAAVCLKETIFWQQVDPILHIVNGFKITLGCIYKYLSFFCFHSNDRRSGNCMYSLLGFDWNFDCHSVIHIGRTQLVGDEERAMKHFCKVNECNYSDYRKALGMANEKHRRLNEVPEWKLDVSIIEKYLSE